MITTRGRVVNREKGEGCISQKWAKYSSKHTEGDWGSPRHISQMLNCLKSLLLLSLRGTRRAKPVFSEAEGWQSPPCRGANAVCPKFASIAMTQ
jgi:hypothetical protein